MSYDALVLDSDAVDLLDSALIENSWFENFDVPVNTKVKRVVVGNIVYLLSHKCTDESRILVIDLSAVSVLKSDGRPKYPFGRILRVALHNFRPEVAIPLQWQSYHAGHLLSVYAENIQKQSLQRIYFDQRPDDSDSGHIFAYYSMPGYSDIREIPCNVEIYRRAIDGLVIAALTDARPTEEIGNFGLILSEPLGASISGGASLAEWYAKRVTRQQKDFIDRPLNSPVRLRGSAGTGKTQSIAIKVLRELRRAEDQQRSLNLAVITHSDALAHDVIRGMLYAMDQSEGWLNFKYAKLWLGTLYQLAQETLQYERKGLQPLSLDGQEGRHLQKLIIEDSIDPVTSRPQFKIDYSSDLSSYMLDLLANREGLTDELMNEFSSIIDAENIQKGTDEAESYFKSNREPWQSPLNEIDRKFVLDVHDVYSRNLQKENFLSMDQMIADFNRYLMTHEWRQLRDRRGFDAVFVDEYHYFSRGESVSLHSLFKSGAAIDGKLPIFMAYDLKQGKDDTALRHGTKAMLNFAATRAGKSDLVELTEVFRSTPEIAEFLRDLDGSFPALDLEGEWTPYGGISTIGRGAKPCLRVFDTNTQLIDAIFETAKARVLELKDGGRQVAVLCMNERLFDTYVTAGRIKDQFIALTDRNQMDELKYAKRKCVFSMPEYVAGLQFDTVFLIHIDEADFDERRLTSGYIRRMISKCYVGASRASQRLEIAASNERGGVSRILAGPIVNKSLIS